MNSEVSQDDSVAFTVDSCRDGVVFGQHRGPKNSDPRLLHQLRLSEHLSGPKLRSRYTLNKSDPQNELERYLMRLSNRGLLSSATIYFGVCSDPFAPFDGKFDISMRFLELFKQYRPGQLIVQTRSPLVVIAMPVFKSLGCHVSITIPIETDDEQAAARYTPGLPRVGERLKAATALRRFGIEVTTQISPILPYGDWRSDAQRFAQVLASCSDYVVVEALKPSTARPARRTLMDDIAHRLAEDRKFHWLRPDTAKPLLTALAEIAPDKLLEPVRPHLNKKQLELFVA